MKAMQAMSGSLPIFSQTGTSNKIFTGLILPWHLLLRVFRWRHKKTCFEEIIQDHALILNLIFMNYSMFKKQDADSMPKMS
jgi:hypothetical protein